MIWDKLSPIYDATLVASNSKEYQAIADVIVGMITPNESVLECACGTGMLSVPIAERCKRLVATDYSEGMLRQTEQKLKAFDNAMVEKVDIMAMPYPDNSFDMVVAANVIHLLDDAADAIKGMLRVCKQGGKVVIPTFVSRHKITAAMAANMATLAGIPFKHHWDVDSYKKFFADFGYEADYKTIDGRMPCVIAIITKQ